nr:50S ribosomal protein L11 methyltransferase [Bacillota bacterium]
MQWTQVDVHTSPEAEEAVSQILLDAGAHGVVIRSGPAGPVVSAYWSDPAPDLAEHIAARVRALADAGLDPGPARVETALVADEDWAQSWKKYYHPLRIGRRLLVKPAWIDAADDDRLLIQLDPGMAFGTGYHPTTVLCLEALEEVVRPGHVVVDVGTGSGILGIAAARLGAAAVIAVDTELEAVEAAAANAARNGVAGVMAVRRGSVDAARELLGDRRADVVVVNILAKVIDELAEDLLGLLKPGGVLVASGIIEHASAPLQERLRSVGFAVEEERARGEWRCLIGRRSD